MQKVRVYWNLHSKIWSVQDVKSGRVCDHVQHISLTDAKFVVRKGGQKRVREEGKKNVHAFAVGYIADNQHLLEHIIGIVFRIIHTSMITLCLMEMKFQKIGWVISI